MHYNSSLVLNLSPLHTISPYGFLSGFHATLYFGCNILFIQNIWCIARHIKKFDKREIDRFILVKNSSQAFPRNITTFAFLSLLKKATAVAKTSEMNF